MDFGHYKAMACLSVDDDYVKFVEKLENAEPEVIPTPEVFLEEIEAREKQMKGQQLQLLTTTTTTTTIATTTTCL